MKSILAEGIEVMTEERQEEPEISKEEHENLQKILEVQNEEVCYDFVLRFTLSFLLFAHDSIIRFVIFRNKDKFIPQATSSIQFITTTNM